MIITNMEYDETKAVEYIRQHAALSQEYDDDELLNVIDIIFDYYEENGLLEIDDDDDDTIDIDDITQFVTRMLHKDKMAKVADIDVRPIIEAEFDYELSLDV